MNIPLEITYRDVKQSAEITAYIKNRAQKLEQYSDHIIKCRVVVEKAIKKQKQQRYNVRITLAVPHQELATHNNVTENMYKSIHNAFNRVQRQLEDHHRTLEGFVKRHDVQTSGVIARLFDQDEFGFIESLDGNEEYYFNSDNLIKFDFDHLEVGDTVHFIQAAGNEGQQAHRVKLAKRRR
jgi:ribosomal subunit interface protein